MIEWRTIPGFPGYIVSAKGQVARLLKGKKLNGRRLYELGSDELGFGKRRSLFAARAVALAWHGPPPHPRMDASHLDGDRTNDTPGNIAWKTRRRGE